MPVPPGGIIPCGIGGRIYVNEIGGDPMAGTSVRAPGGAVPMFDVSNWQIQDIWHNAECTHSGTFGAISRRLVAFDFRWFATVAYDIENPPDTLLDTYQPVVIRFNIGDASLDPNQSSAGISQSFYMAPSALIDVCRTVLDATGRDVVRQEVSGSGNSVLMLINPNAEYGDDSSWWYNSYKPYLVSRGWAV